MKSIGLMSGTSCDGVDAVLLEVQTPDEPSPCTVLEHNFVPFPDALQNELSDPTKLTVQRIAELHFQLADFYRRAARGMNGWEAAECCGLHGQTIWHRPSGPFPTTFQIGSSAALSEALRLPVVGDLRSADVALGGQGAPIVPFAHWFFLARKLVPTLVVNFGGICNITWVSPDINHVIAYDVGPGMLISNAFASLSTNGTSRFDEDGRLSAGGKVVQALLDFMRSHPFIAKKPPKSTGREDFGSAYYSDMFERFRGHHSDADISYTLLVATAEILRATTKAEQRIVGESYDVILTGGGAKNPLLAAEVRRLFDRSNVAVIEDGPLAPQNHEPAAVALIAARTMRKLASSLPNVTGARRPAILGHIHYPS